MKRLPMVTSALAVFALGYAAALLQTEALAQVKDGYLRPPDDVPLTGGQIGKSPIKPCVSTGGCLDHIDSVFDKRFRGLGAEANPLSPDGKCATKADVVAALSQVVSTIASVNKKPKGPGEQGPNPYAADGAGDSGNPSKTGDMVKDQSKGNPLKVFIPVQTIKSQTQQIEDVSKEYDETPKSDKK